MAGNLERWCELKSVLNSVMLTRLAPLVLLCKEEFQSDALLTHVPIHSCLRCTSDRSSILEEGYAKSQEQEVKQEGGFEVTYDIPGESLMSRNSEYNSDTANKMSPYMFSIPPATGRATCIRTVNHFSLKNKVANSRLPTANRSWPALSLNHTRTLAAANWHRSKPVVLVQLE